ncbi:MAG: Clp protease ClpP [Marivita sp.]|uniref:head maturation protease, ClpP-related n=1 Tax=Marivita sp. TaxID=2003365 RepID=UPI001B290EB0|nr:head maturation protease, ClpP-related [Marivita sp.]MBO6883860.1 Clp protease ClpP [Marivita sp.]
MKSWYTIRARGTGAEVLIYDEIGAYGVTAKGFLAELGALPDGLPIDLRLNSPGGSVFDAVAIYNALQRHEGEITVWIDGIAASAASYVAMAGDEIVMPENAFLMIHNPSGLVMGTSAEMREMAATMDKIAGSMIRGYAARSGRSEEEIAALMAAETWFDAEAAIATGLATRMVEPVRIAASFDIASFRNAPPVLVEATVDQAATADDEVAFAEDLYDLSEREPVGGHAAGDDTGRDAEPLIVDEQEPLMEQVDIAPGVSNENTQSSETPTSDPPGDPAPDAQAIRAEAIAHARAVIDLCRLAGQPQMSGRFLEEDVGLDEVRSRLLAAKATAVPDITSSAHAQPGRAITANPWGEVIARTFRQKG